MRSIVFGFLLLMSGVTLAEGEEQKAKLLEAYRLLGKEVPGYENALSWEKVSLKTMTEKAGVPSKIEKSDKGETLVVYEFFGKHEKNYCRFKFTFDEHGTVNAIFLEKQHAQDMPEEGLCLQFPANLGES